MTPRTRNKPGSASRVKTCAKGIHEGGQDAQKWPDFASPAVRNLRAKFQFLFEQV